MYLNKLHIITIFSVLGLMFFSHGQNLEDYIQIAQGNNPSIKAFEKQHHLISEKVNAINVYPDTKFSAGYFTSEPKTRNGAQHFKISASQMLPKFGLINAKENYIKALVEEKQQDVIIAKRKIATEVTSSYYNLYALNAKQLVLDKTLALLDTYKTLILSSIQSGKSSAVHILRLQIQRNDVEAKKNVLAHQYNGEQAVMNKLLNRDANTKVNVVHTLDIPANNDSIKEDSLHVHPELVKYDKLYESVTKSELVNQKEKNAQLGFGLDYVNIRKRPDMTFNHNGKDVFMPMVSLSVPLFNSKYKSVSAQNKIQQDIINNQRLERLNNLKALLNQAKANKNIALVHYNTQLLNVKQAKDAENLMVNSYQTGTINFNDILDIQELQLKFQLHQIDAIKNYYLQNTIINYLTQ